MLEVDLIDCLEGDCGGFIVVEGGLFVWIFCVY